MARIILVTTKITMKILQDFILEKCDVCFKPIEELYVKDNYGNIYHSHHRSRCLCVSLVIELYVAVLPMEE